MNTIKLTKSQAQTIVRDTLKEYLMVEMRFSNNDRIIEAYKAVLGDFASQKEIQTWMHDFAKQEKKYNSKRLVEANNGL